MREPLNIIMIAAARQSLKSTKNTSTHIIYDKISGKSCLGGSFFFPVVFEKNSSGFWGFESIPVVFGSSGFKICFENPGNDPTKTTQNAWFSAKGHRQPTKTNANVMTKS